MQADKKHSSGRLYETILENIKAMIDNQEIKPGEKLPPERVLAEYYDVSRVPVREAIKILEYMGVVENRQGDGMYLKKCSNINSLISRIDFPEKLTSDVMIDLFEMRIILESKACFYAAQRRTAEDIVALEKVLKQMRATLRDLKGYDALPLQLKEAQAVSHKFHTSIVSAAHNMVLSSIYNSLFELLDISKQLTLRTSGHTHNSILVHELILSKIIAQDSAGAEQAMSEHLSDARALVVKTLHEKDEE